MDFAVDMKTDDFFNNNGRDSTNDSNQALQSKKRRVAQISGGCAPPTS